MNLKQLFTKHPHQIGETYGQHCKNAQKIGWSMIFAGSKCLIHSIFTFLFLTSASDCVAKLNYYFNSRKAKSD